jgi:hypothetical protein
VGYFSGVLIFADFSGKTEIAKLIFAKNIATHSTDLAHTLQ